MSSLMNLTMRKIDLLYNVPVLIYHSLDKELVDSYAAVDLKVFERQMAYVKNNGYKTITVADYAKALIEGKRLDRKTVVITFDDGFADNYDGFKLMQEMGLAWTLFMPWDYIDKDNYLSTVQIEEFLNNSKMELASHGVKHKYLLELKPDEWKDELVNSKKLLEDKFLRPIETFSYPIGGFNRDIIKATKEAGYLCACATNRGYERKLDSYAIRRIKINNTDNERSLFFKLSGYYELTKKLKYPE